ncbi:thioredoxin family protein [Psychroflexus aestuariivivens]|uniref:thioredoxin family protein n=1 Tax=Psychroflexus aestuariivivens TaxID=1795040 RepID=UPI000FD8B630|nr:thioredoxin family protein [Psychroflexus aestuariivivens]
MTKFGDLIDIEQPILLNFYTEWSEDCEEIHDLLKSVSAAVGDRAKIIKIDAEKNQDLVDALKVKKLPTYMLYKSGDMVWRDSKKYNANELINLLEDFN